MTNSSSVIAGEGVSGSGVDVELDVGAGVDDDGAAEDALGADQLDELVGDGALGVALGVGLEVAQVTDVALGVGGGAVGLVVGVDWWEERGVSWLYGTGGLLVGVSRDLQ